jgi:hypothetical protein
MIERLVETFEARREAGKRHLIALAALSIALAAFGFWLLDHHPHGDFPHVVCLPLLPLALALCLLGISGLAQNLAIGLITKLLPEPRQPQDVLDPEGIGKLSWPHFEQLLQQAQVPDSDQQLARHAHETARQIRLQSLYLKAATALVLIWLLTPLVLIFLAIPAIYAAAQLPHPHERRKADTPANTVKR